MSIALDEGAPAAPWLTARRAVWLLAIAGIAVAALLTVRLVRTFEAKNAVTNKIGIPVVSVTEVGRSAVPTTVSIIGTVGARFDTPIGVEGDGGRVAAIYVEAGDHVKRGQMLARLDMSVLQPQVANLQAAWNYRVPKRTSPPPNIAGRLRSAPRAHCRPRKPNGVDPVR